MQFTIIVVWVLILFRFPCIINKRSIFNQIHNTIEYRICNIVQRHFYRVVYILYVTIMLSSAYMLSVLMDNNAYLVIGWIVTHSIPCCRMSGNTQMKRLSVNVYIPFIQISIK